VSRPGTGGQMEKEEVIPSSKGNSKGNNGFRAELAAGRARHGSYSVGTSRFNSSNQLMTVMNSVMPALCLILRTRFPSGEMS